MSDRLVVGISGASGTYMAVELLKVLSSTGIEVHLVVSDAAKDLLVYETGVQWSYLSDLAHRCYDNSDLFAPIASGSFWTRGMVIVPCSMRTLGAIASGNTSTLMQRAADVCLKERRRLVLVVRETPLSLIHLENMERITRAGGIVFPPVVTLYSKPKTIQEMINHILGKVLDLFDVEHDLYSRWEGRSGGKTFDTDGQGQYGGENSSSDHGTLSHHP